MQFGSLFKIFISIFFPSVFLINSDRASRSPSSFHFLMPLAQYIYGKYLFKFLCLFLIGTIFLNYLDMMMDINVLDLGAVLGLLGPFNY